MQDIKDKQELDIITDKVCLSEVSLSMLEGYIDLLGDITQDINDNKIQALIHALEIETDNLIKNTSNIEELLIKYKNKSNTSNS